MMVTITISQEDINEIFRLLYEQDKTSKEIMLLSEEWDSIIKEFDDKHQSKTLEDMPKLKKSTPNIFEKIKLKVDKFIK